MIVLERCIQERFGAATYLGGPFSDISLPFLVRSDILVLAAIPSERLENSQMEFPRLKTLQVETSTRKTKKEKEINLDRRCSRVVV